MALHRRMAVLLVALVAYLKSSRVPDMAMLLSLGSDQGSLRRSRRGKYQASLKWRSPLAIASTDVRLVPEGSREGYATNISLGQTT
jgi:hypothetical protein